jgi:fatty acid synthase
VLFPATAYLHSVWETLGLMMGVFFFEVGVVFEDVKFLRATALPNNQDVELVVMIQPGTGRFEITEGTSPLATGFVKIVDDVKLADVEMPENDGYPILQQRDFYKELRLRGYHYNGLFRCVEEARGDGLVGKIKWNSNWVSFMDCLLQVHIIGQDSRALLLPTGIQRLSINPEVHKSFVHTFENEDITLDVCSDPESNILRCGGIEIRGLQASPVARRRPPGIPVLENYQFIPHLPAPYLSKIDMARFCVQLALENVPTNKVLSIEVDSGDDDKDALSESIALALGDLPLVTAELNYITQKTIELGSIIVSDSKLTSFKNAFMLIKSNCLSDKSFLQSVVAILQCGGFVIARESNEINLQILNEIPSEFTLIALVPTENETIIMLQCRKKIASQTQKIVRVTSQNYDWLDVLKSSMKEGPVIAYSEKEEFSGIVGLVNCIRKEPNGLNLKCILIDDYRAPDFNVENEFYTNIVKQGLAVNVFKNGQWGSYKHLLLEPVKETGRRVDHCFANSLVRGDLSSMTWLHGPYNHGKPDGDIVKVQYASLNFRDVMLATGKLTAEVFGSGRLDQLCILGFEYSGLSETGRRVMGMVISGALSTHIKADDTLLWDCPSQWTLEQAATVPVTYGTVYSAFFLTTKIEAGKKILIHAGSGGVGLAAIRVAFAYGLDVFTTVSTEEKRNYLLNEFPQLKRENIGNSRDISFEDMIMKRTSGKGVDYVLNSLAEEKLHASIRCLGKGGKFLEIGKFDLANDTKIGLGAFLKEISFHSVLVDHLFKASPEDKLVLQRLLEKDIERGIIKPLKTTVFNASEIVDAFRFLASGKHIGKVLLRVREDVHDNATLPITAYPRSYCNPFYSYIIPGGLGGFGLELADWLVLRGCRKLILSSSRGITKQYQAYRIRIWESYGVQVSVNTSDITSKSGCEQLIRDAMKYGPVGGIFNLAVTLRDSIFENQDVTKFTECMGPKAVATKYLDEISRVLCPEMQYFVVFSSVSCGRGNAGQSNYGMANSVMEQIIEQRHALGLPAKAIQWGAVGEVGLVADMQEDHLDMEIGGTLQQRISSCLEEMDTLLSSSCPLVGSMVVAEKRVRSGKSVSVIDAVMSIMSIRDIKSVSMDASLSEIGMDSLMAVEIRQMLEREYELFLSPQDLRSLTFMKLQELTASSESGDHENSKVKFANEDVPVGVELMLRNLGDEKTSDQTILRLMSQDNSTKHTSCVLLIPGIEGVAGNAWRNVANSLSLPTYMLQLMSTKNLFSIHDVTNAIYEEVIEKVFNKNIENFYIVGYSFGAMIALELTKLLERNGKKGKLVLMDGAPVFLKKLVVDQMPTSNSDDAVQSVLLSGILRTVFPEEKVDVLKVMSDNPTWDGRVESIIELCSDQYLYTTEYLRTMANCLFHRIKMVLDYKQDFKTVIKTHITLIRPSEISIVDVDEDYGLKKLTNGGTSVRFIDGNHLTMLENEKLVQIINELDPALENNRSFMKHNMI